MSNPLCPITHILSVSRKVNTGNKSQIMHAITEETGELATEVAIAAGFKKREPGKDGIVGEAIDLMMCAVDMIYAENPHITLHEIMAIVQDKCKKWEDGVEKLKNGGR